MMMKYATGNVLPPMAENTYETVYFKRPRLEQVSLPQILTKNCTKCFIGENDASENISVDLDAHATADWSKSIRFFWLLSFLPLTCGVGQSRCTRSDAIQHRLASSHVPQTS